ncbi:ABC transporter a family member 2 [Phtheirospermum japonicum]|uniref:ABC transporter a family member 2 n=1 Tax=Phtheirospermum japonicum TaxID=374723 RepID=A0A830CF23_9LAMI|nr:ABC transporter a family member 2 [Phtheirospermum japonicum]
MELQRGVPLLAQQYKALFVKNLLLSWRNKRATFLQLFSSLFFILLIFLIQKAIESSYSSSSSFERVTDPQPLVAPPIPPCEDKFYTRLPCFDFVWSGNSSARITEIVRRIRENNPGRPIPAEKVRAFTTPDETDDWLASNPMYCPGALHFIDRSATVISYGLQTNSTPLSNRGNFEDPTFKFQIPLQLAAEREIARSLIGDASFSWVVSIKEFAHPAREIFSAVQNAGPTFFLAIAMFSFVFQISALVTEKELKLRQAMTMMGLYDTAYWLSWLTWEGLVVLLSSLFTTGFAFMLSAFVTKSASSTTVGFFIFIIGFVSQLVTTFGFPYSQSFSDTYRTVWSFFPPNLFAGGLHLLSDATATPQDPGVSWNGRTRCAPNDTECVITMNEIYIWLISTSCLWFLLAIYFDNIFPNTYGVRKSVFYFLHPGYWTEKGGNKSEEGSICSCMSTSVPLTENIVPDDEDVQEEESIVKQQAAEGIVNPSIAVQIRGLVKTYSGATNIGCCKCKRTPPYHALKGIWLNFPKDQLFCLLGPNGAGKTTTINCLTGITPATGGDALVYGYSVRSSTGMSNVRRMIGVCPQFDILWDALSGQEHLYLFASIKGLKPSSIKLVAQKLLAEVKLTDDAKVRSCSYSGGMKRRLSVAIALIGEPKLLILDEPTTGMDPITRRHVWDVIENAKQGRAIILTTHSMEEADILSDRIGIMAKGRLRCIGTSIRLKSRFGTGFIANISFAGDVSGTPDRGDTVSTAPHVAVKEFFKSHLDVSPKEESKSFLTFVIPHEKEKLLKNREKEFFIADIQLGLTTLEEVFLNIAKKAELETAAAEGTFASLILNSGVSVQVPIGARFIGIPGTESTENPRGIMVEVFWQQDDTGTLCIAGYSDELPIPPHVQLATSTTAIASHRNNSRRQRQIQGIVIDPSQIADSDLR